MSFFRRAGALIARFFTSAADPAAAAGEFPLYSKSALGVSQLFGRSDDGTVHQITPAGGGGGASADNVLTYRPGGADVGPIVFNDFDALYAQLVALRTAASASGLFTIVFDNSLGSPIVPASTFDFARTEWTAGDSTGGSIDIQIADGAVITNLLILSGAMGIAPAGTTTTPPITLAAGQTLKITGSRLRGSSSALVVIAGGFNADIQLLENGVLGGVSETAGAILVPDGEILTVRMDGAGATIGTDAFSANIGTINVFAAESSAYYEPLQISVTTPPVVTQITPAWYYPGDPNGNVVATYSGFLCTDRSAGAIYRSTGGSTWTVTAL